jgi:YegS/Rv2252/BmrU family lipid kinase
MKEFTFIVNPAAGKGSGNHVFRSIQSELEKRNIEFNLVETTGSGHATAAARNADTATVVSVGGDGTINEVVNGLSGSTKNLGIIPAGSGNDFIKSIGVPRKPLLALQTLLNGVKRAVDLGTVRCTESKEGGGNFEPRLFVNGVGVGFDAAVAARTREIRFLSGTPLYVLAVLQTLGKYIPPEFTILSESFTRTSRGLLIAVGNGKCAGGGFYLTPDAAVDDGLLDVCSVDNKNIVQILSLMPRVMRGKHHNVAGVKLFQEKRLSIAAAEPFYVHADGEIVGAGVRRVEIGVHTSHLSVISPNNSGSGIVAG